VELPPKLQAASVAAQAGPAEEVVRDEVLDGFEQNVAQLINVLGNAHGSRSRALPDLVDDRGLLLRPEK
jgi:hypothetical protein